MYLVVGLSKQVAHTHRGGIFYNSYGKRIVDGGAVKRQSGVPLVETHKIMSG